MAVTSIWPITGNPDGVIEYAINPQKTSETSLEETAALHAIDNVVEYTANDLKTEKRMYVSGVNCQIPYAKEQFMETKRHFGKMDGRTCYHGYQSFRAGEVDAETAHRIGVALAKELWGDRFEVVVATHLNTDHYHNHFVINSVSFTDGLKFYNLKADYTRMRQVSDRLCKEHRLSVIKDPQGKGKHYCEWAAEQNGKPTYRSIVKADIDRAVLASTTMRDFHRVMEQMGYTFKRFKKNGQPLVHPVAVPPGGGKGVRMDGLGEAYTFEGIAERILQNMRKQVPFPEVKNRRIGPYRYRDSFKKHPKATGLRALYFYYCYKLKIIVKNPASVKRVPDSLREDIVKLDKRIEETRFLGKHHIETATQLSDRKQFAQAQIVSITDRRRDLRNALKRVTRTGDPEEIAAVKAQIDALSAELKQYRKEVGLCDSIAERSGIVKTNLETIIHQQESERKEKTEHEHISRRGRTDRPNVPGWR